MRTRRLVPVTDIGLMPTPESSRTCFLPPLSMSLLRNSIRRAAIGSALFPLDSGVDVFGVLAEDDDIHALGMLHGRRDAVVVLHRTDAGVEIENLAQGDVQGANAAAHGRGQRTFDGDAKFADGADGVVGQPVLKTGFGLFAGKNFVPCNRALSAVGFFDGGVEYADGCFPDVAAGAVALR